MDPISRLRKSNGTANKAGTKKPGSPPKQPAATAELADPDNAGNVRVQVAQRIARLDPADPRQRAAAVRVFVEQVLAQEFGHAAVASASFQRRITDVQRSMTQDEVTSAELDRVITALQAPPTR